MGTAAAPWKQLLFGAIEANSHLKHSSYAQLVSLPFSILLVLFTQGAKFLSSVDICRRRLVLMAALRIAPSSSGDTTMRVSVF